MLKLHLQTAVLIVHSNKAIFKIKKSVINCIVKQTTRTKLLKKRFYWLSTLKKLKNSWLIKRSWNGWVFFVVVVVAFFSHKPCYRSSASRIGLRMAVLAVSRPIQQFSCQYDCPWTYNRASMKALHYLGVNEQIKWAITMVMSVNVLADMGSHTEK